MFSLFQTTFASIREFIWASLNFIQKLIAMMIWKLQVVPILTPKGNTICIQSTILQTVLLREPFAADVVSGFQSNWNPNRTTRVARPEPLPTGANVSQDINVVALVKGEERYIFLFNDKKKGETLRTLGRYASDGKLSFSWYDAAVLSQKVRNIQKTEAPSEISPGRFATPHLGDLFSSEDLFSGEDNF